VECLEGYVLINYDVSIHTVAVAMVHSVMDTEQEDVRALEDIFEAAVLQAREYLRESIHG